ncbi:YceK/YidQ family lipoprotein [Pseudomonas syringae]|uniref:YceK/YidQ family lipoprotein n=1 Tax=Pseudomonas syringae TaxID=317 RepID=UPI000EFFE7EB|nr:YceK/YidQ family lipoprotein [Pseudomonas azotoformans]
MSSIEINPWGNIARRNYSWRFKVGVLKRLIKLVFFCLITITAGCGTLVERGTSSKTYHDSDYYLGVTYDWNLLTLKGQGSYDPIPTLCYLSIFCPFITLASIPVDLAVDTLMLYSDHKNKLIEDRKFNAYLRGRYCLDGKVKDDPELNLRNVDVDFCLGIKEI